MRVFQNGNFISCEEENRLFSVLVEDGGRIVYTGDTVPAEYAGAETVDLNGACAIPCFGDTHAHFTSTAYLQVDTRVSDNLSEVLEHIGKTCATINTPFITGFGLSPHAVKEKRLPTAQELDKIVDKPLFIKKYDGHSGVLNTAMMDFLPQELADGPGLDRETGLCVGETYQKIATYLVGIKEITPQEAQALFDKTIHSYLSRGYNLIVPVEGMANSNANVELTQANDGKTPLRFRTFFQTLDVDKVLECGYKRVGGCYATALDGCFGAEDAALLEPYDNDPANKGWLVYDQQTITDFAIKANRAGLQMCLHAIGDAAVEQCFLAYEAALADCPREDHRHIILHADLFPEKYLERAGKLDLYCAVQSEFVNWKEEPVEFLAGIVGDRAYQKHCFTKMLAAGLTLTNGSDSPCTHGDPFYAIWSACNHPNPAYSLDALTALKMSTLYPAMLTFDEKDMGTLTNGKVADFLVLDRNILGIPKTDIKDLRIKQIYHGGMQYAQ